MTVLSACAEAAIELNHTEPSTLFSTTDQFAKELRTQANKTASALLKIYDWQKLITLQTMTGDGTTTSFALPSDYDRMVLKSNVLSSSFASPLARARDMDMWLDLQIRDTLGYPGYWIILGGTMQILPALSSGVTAKFYYVKNTIVASAASAAQTSFTADSDTFNLSERLLTLGVIWRWRAQKRMEYAEDLRNYEIALEEAIGRDKGSRMFTVGNKRLPDDVSIAHPEIVV